MVIENAQWGSCIVWRKVNFYWPSERSKLNVCLLRPMIREYESHETCQRTIESRILDCILQRVSSSPMSYSSPPLSLVACQLLINVWASGERFCISLTWTPLLKAMIKRLICLENLSKPSFNQDKLSGDIMSCTLWRNHVMRLSLLEKREQYVFFNCKAKHKMFFHFFHDGFLKEHFKNVSEHFASLFHNLKPLLSQFTFQ